MTKAQNVNIFFRLSLQLKTETYYNWIKSQKINARPRSLPKARISYRSFWKQRPKNRKYLINIKKDRIRNCFKCVTRTNCKPKGKQQTINSRSCTRVCVCVCALERQNVVVHSRKMNKHLPWYTPNVYNRIKKQNFSGFYTVNIQFIRRIRYVGVCVCTYTMKIWNTTLFQHFDRICVTNVWWLVRVLYGHVQLQQRRNVTVSSVAGTVTCKLFFRARVCV